MKYPQTWVEEPIFDAGEVAKRASDRSSMVGALPKKRDETDAAAVADFLANRGGNIRLTAEEQRASDVRANKRGQGRKHIGLVMKGWASHGAARALPTKAEIEAMEAGCGTWAVTGDRPLNEPCDAKVSFPKAPTVPEPICTPPSAPIVIPGRCANADCGNPIPSKMLEKGARCCCKNCAQTYRRSRNAKILADRVFVPKAPKPATRRTVEHDLTPAEYFKDLVEMAEAHAEWDAQAAEDAAKAKREAEIDAMLEGLSKRVPRPVYSRRVKLENSRNP